MNPDVLAHLRCPVCRQPLRDCDGTPPSLRCASGHSFDVARQGYADLTAGRSPHAGDSTDMVGARAAFLAAGHYDFVRDALVGTATELVPRPGFMVDAGAGTGWHLAALADAVPAATGLALDVSKPALRRAARAHPRVAAARCDTWTGLPLADATVDLLLNVFAPRNGAEFHRVLRPTGALLVVTPDHDHLAELVGPLGLLRVDPTKGDRVAGTLTGRFAAATQASHRRLLRLRHPEVTTLVHMGPSARHLDPPALAAAVAALPEPVTVTAAVRLTGYHPTPAARP